MAVPTPNQYWIRPDALTFSLNTPDVDYLRVSVLAGSAIIAYMEGVIDYDPSHNHRKWPIQAADTFLETTEPYYVHAQLTRSESTPTALIVYSLTKRSITGKIIEEDGTETGEEDQDYFYVYLGKISSSIDKNGQKVGRTWIEAYNPGKLDTNQGRAEDMDGHYLSKLFDDIARGVITFENGIRFGNLLLALEGNDTLFLKNTLTGEQANFAASGAIATKGVGASSGGGGVIPWSEIENSIIPKVTDTYSIGTNTNKWQSIYAIEGHFNSLVAHALNAESIKLNGKDVATKEYVVAMVAQGGGGGGTGGSSTVSYLPAIGEGKEIGTLIVDGVSYGLFAPSKYSWEEIDDKPNFAKVAFSGSYNDLADVPTFYTLTIQKNGEEVGTFTPNSEDETINIDDVVTLSDEQEITGRKMFKGGVRLDSNTVIRNAQFIGTNASDAVLWKVDNTGNATFVNGVLGGTLSVAKESTFTGETTHNGGIVIPSGKTLKIGNTVIEEKDGGLFVNGDLAASGSVATKGVGSSSGGGGNSYGRLDNWDNYDASKGDVLSALLGYGLKSDITTLTNKFGNYFTKNETRNEIVAYLHDFNAEMIVPNYSTKSEVGSLADVVGGIGTRVSILEGKATAVSFAQTLQSGKQIGVLSIDGTPTTLFAPAGYAWGEITSRPTKLSDFTDDVVSGKYLSLNGGTMSGDLTIGTSSTTEKYYLRMFCLQDSEVHRLLAGITDTKDIELSYYSPTVGTYARLVLGTSGYKIGGHTLYDIIHSGNIGRQSVNYATSAGSVAWANVTNKPTTLAGYGITDKVAIQKQANDFVFASNEITLIPSKYSGHLWLNYRTVTGTDGYLPYYNLGNGAGGYAGLVTSGVKINNGTSSQFLKADGSLDSTAYLPLNGGTLNIDGIFTFRASSAFESSGYGWARNFLNFASQDGNSVFSRIGVTGYQGDYYYMYIGSSDYNGLNLRIYSDKVTWGNNDIIHTGNISSQSVNYATSSGTANILNKIYSENINYDAYSSHVKLIKYNSNWQDSGFPSNHTSGLSVQAGYVGWQLLVYGGYTDTLYFRKNNDDNTWRDWKTIAFTDSNVASADKLSDNTVYTVWGQTFFENGKPKNVIGALGLESSSKIYWYSDAYNYYINADYSIASNAPNLNYCAFNGHRFIVKGSNNAMILNSSGNVTIGASDLASTTTKLYVDGGIRFAPRTIWGQSFDGTGNVGGSLTGTNFLLMDRASNPYLKFTENGLNGFIQFLDGTIAMGPTFTNSLLVNNNGNVTIGSIDLAGTTAKLYVDGSASAYYFKEKTISSRRQETGYNWYTIYSANVGTQGDNVIIKLSHSYWHQETDSVILCASIGYDGAMINQLSYSKTGSSVFKQARIRKYGDTYYVDVLLHNTEANTDMFFVTGSGKGDFVNFELVTSTDYLLITEHTLSAGAMSVGGALSVGDNITSAGAITIKDTVYGIGTTGVIRGSKLVSEGTIETSTLKVGSILIEDKEGDLFINGNLAASGSVATKGIGTSSSGGSATIPWSALENSLISASTSYNLGSSAKPWGSVYANSGTINKFTVGSTKIGDTTGYWSITHAGVASFSYVKVNGYNVATEQSVASSLSNYLLKSGGDIEGDLSLFGDYVRFRDCYVLGLSDSGSTQYWSISNVGAASFASLKIGNYNAATQDYVQNNFAANSDAIIDSSLTVYSTNRNVTPTIKLESSDWIWDVRNEPSALSFYSISPSGGASSVMALNTSGNLSISGRLTQSSDETLKNILGYNVNMKVRDIANAPICYFTWKDRISDRQVGTIAQYWKLITPECVIGEEGRMSMDYSTLGLVSSIVNAREIVKHEDEIEALKKRVKELEDKLAAVSAA